MRKIRKVTLMTVLCSLSLLFAAPGLTISADAATPPGEGTVAPCADIIEWVYEQRGHELYKRLYNASTAEWIGEWIYVGEIPGKNPNPGTDHGRN